MSSDKSPAFVRTLVPIVIGPLVARFFPGLDLKDPDTLLLVSAVVSYIYYVFVRVVEDKYPKFGYFLGIAKAPAYSKEPAPSPGPGEEVEAVVVPGDGEAEADSGAVVAPEPVLAEHGPRVVSLEEMQRVAKKLPAKKAPAKKAVGTPVKRVPVKRAPPRA